MKTILNYSLLIFAVISFIGCKKTVEKGVSIQLAKDRKEHISNIQYHLNFSIPKSKSQNIIGKLDINFNIDKKDDVVLDFREDSLKVISIKVNGNIVNCIVENGHIIVPSKYIKQGSNSVFVDFIAGESSLNRKEEFLYTLLVPDRASTLFPCFDQPDLKAIYNLTLNIPDNWKAVTNGKLQKEEKLDSTKTLSFGSTVPLSTYLFAFVVGKFDTISRVEDGRKIVMYHRENDSLKVKRNLDAIFSSHYHSLSWLKDYTGIEYPFGKLDIILIPDFQYSGMEHPGAIYYRDSQLLLDEKPSVNQKLRAANLIAHEVAHQWFGDLVTMRWFNDVWLKEVFAGFMADKIVNPQFTEVNHNLRFLLSHYPRAYSVDRTDGANPIRQNLENLLFAGTMYGDIIYHKAPIMMMQLEMLMGEEPFKKGVRKYLETFSMGNADWEELVDILDQLTPENLASWSNAWVNLPGMPSIQVNAIQKDKLISEFEFIQSKNISSPTMGMSFNAKPIDNNVDTSYNCLMIKDTLVFKSNISYGLILPNSDGKGYGAFYPDSNSLKKLLSNTSYLKNDLARASWVVMLNELFLNGKVDAQKYFSLLVEYLQKETEPQVRQYILNGLELVWWNFFSEEQRVAEAKNFEGIILQLLNSSSIKDDERKPLFQTYTRISTTADAQQNIFKIWKDELKIKGLKIDEPDYMALAYELAVRGFGNSDSILTAQEQRIKNKDRKAKFMFIRRAVSTDLSVRNAFFTSLSDVANRRPEAWVTEALRYLHHPLRANTSINYLKPSLNILPEIQRTGDIFFPKSWLESTLWGYSSEEAYSIITSWLNENPNLPKTLKDKVLQSSHLIKRKVTFN